MARTTLNMERDNSDSLKPHFKCFKYAMINFFIFCRGVKKNISIHFSKSFALVDSI